jgi:hypothetical protein
MLHAAMPVITIQPKNDAKARGASICARTGGSSDSNCIWRFDIFIPKTADDLSQKNRFPVPVQSQVYVCTDVVFSLYVPALPV